MGTVIWKGDAQAIRQIDTLTVGGTIEAGDLFKVMIGNRTVTVEASSTDADTTAGEIASALTAAVALYAEFNGLTIEDTTSVSTGTLTVSSQPGVPFSLSALSTENDGGTLDDQTFSKTTTQAATGPNHWDNADNWDTDAVPIDGDDVIIGNSSRSILYGLDQSAVTLASLKILQSFTGTIGLPEFASTPAGTYEEYRDKYLQIASASVEIGEGSGSGSGRIRLDNGSTNTTLLIHNTGAPLETGVPSVLWLCTNTGSDIIVNKGSLGVAFYPGESAALDSLRMAYRTQVKSDTSVVLGRGVSTLGSVAKAGGTLQLSTSSSSIVQVDGGETMILGGTHTAILVYAGTLAYESSGTITLLAAAGAKSVADFTRDLRARTVVNCSLFAGASLLDPAKTITFTNPLSVNCKLTEVSLDFGTDFNLQRS